MTTAKPPIPPSRWWVSLARPKVKGWSPDPGYAALSKELAKAVGRKRPWSHSALVRFATIGTISADLAAAVSVYFKLPKPAFVARSAKEAFEMQAIADKYDNEPVSEIEAEIIEMEQRLEERRRELAERELAERTAADHQPLRGGRRKKV